MLDLRDLCYSEPEIQAKREEIARRILRLSPHMRDRSLPQIAVSDLRLLFELYDEVFLKRQFAKGFQGKIKFSLSRRLTQSAGKTICPKNIAQLAPEDVMIEIRMGVDFFFNYDRVNSEKRVNGILTRNALEAFQLVFEHELCHAMEFINFHTSNCRQKRFKTMSKNIFGHLDNFHQLPTQGRIIQEKMGLNPGDTVWFLYGKKRVQGLLYRISKRATVMVETKNGRYMDKKGNRYSKFYVPVELINKVATE